MNKPFWQQRPRCSAPERRGPPPPARRISRSEVTARPPPLAAGVSKEREKVSGRRLSQFRVDFQEAVSPEDPVLLSLRLIVAVVLLCLQVAFANPKQLAQSFVIITFSYAAVSRYPGFF